MNNLHNSFVCQSCELRSNEMNIVSKIGLLGLIKEYKQNREMHMINLNPNPFLNYT